MGWEIGPVSLEWHPTVGGSKISVLGKGIFSGILSRSQPRYQLFILLVDDPHGSLRKVSPWVATIEAWVKSLSEYPVFFSSAGSSAHLLSGFWKMSRIWPARVTQIKAPLLAGLKGPIGRRRNGE